VRVSWLAYELSDVVAEVDINPLIVTPHGAVGGGRADRSASSSRTR
jgi:hypothetical protein